VFNGMLIGQYLPGDSWLHRLDPRTKLLLVLLYSILVFIPSNLYSIAMAAVFLVVAVAVGRIPTGYLWRGMRPILFFALIALVFNLFLTPGKTIFQWGFLTVTDEGLHIAVLAMSRLILVVLAATLLTLTTSPVALTDGLERLMRPLARLRFPAHEIALMMTIALRFVPTLIGEADRLIKAQEARGAEMRRGGLFSRIRAMIPILVPLFVSSFRRADDLAVAMEARLYRGGEGRTRMYELAFSKADWAAFGLFLVAAAGIIWFMVR